jgi:MFS transporter, DHA1 family, multidrug resistance protein
VYDRGAWFPAFFGALAVLLALGALNNARIVGRLGVRRIVRRFSLGALAATGVLATLSLVTDGRPNFWLFALAIGLMLPLTQGLVPNCNTAAMVPVAHVAGTAAAIIATVTIGGSAILGGVLSGAFDRTTTPYSVGAFVFHVPAVALIWYVTSGKRGRVLDNPTSVTVPVE